MITFFIFRIPIIAGWGIGTILWPIRNSIWICGWRLDRLVDPIKIGFTGSPTLRLENLRATRSVSTVGSSQSVSSTQSKEFMALQQHMAQLIEKYDHLSAEDAQLKAEHAQQKTDHEQLREMVMNPSQSGDTCGPHPFWSYNHQPPPSPPPPPLY